MSSSHYLCRKGVSSCGIYDHGSAHCSLLASSSAGLSRHSWRRERPDPANEPLKIARLGSVPRLRPALFLFRPTTPRLLPSGASRRTNRLPVLSHLKKERVIYMQTYVDSVSNRRNMLVLAALFTVSLVAMGLEPVGLLPPIVTLPFGLVFLVILCIGLPAIYFCPAIVAHKRRHRNMTALLMLNIFLGWSLLGWVGCLVWALVEQERQTS